jgi:hypothetical protein
MVAAFRAAPFRVQAQFRMVRIMANASDEDRTGDLLIQEVDEDLRREQYVKLWRRYGGWVIVGAVALVVGVAGWQGWQAWQAHQREEAAKHYAAAIALLDSGKTKDAEDALAKISGGDRGFAALAGMRRAELLVKNGDTKGAMAAYETLADGDLPKELRDLATVKEGLLALNAPGDTGPAEARVGAVAVSGNPWYYQATELIALFAHRKGDDKHAVEIFKQLADDPQAPAGVRGRAAEMLAALGPTPPVAAEPGKAPAPASQDKK